MAMPIPKSDLVVTTKGVPNTIKAKRWKVARVDKRKTILRPAVNRSKIKQSKKCKET